MKKVNIPYAETEYGFKYGGAHIERYHSCKKTGRVWVTIKTERTEKNPTQIMITKTGKIRVFSKGGEWKVVGSKCGKCGHALN